MSRLLAILTCFLSSVALSSETSELQEMHNTIDTLEKPVYKPFIERYVLDELRRLRVEQANNKNEMLKTIVDRDYQAVDRAVAYATDTVTYFFYLIAAASTVLVLVGWSSLREVKERVHSLADEKVNNLVDEYETRLELVESQLKQKSIHIEENREEIELTQEVQALWLKAQQETSPNIKISIYDDILKLRPSDCQALTYKADAALELGEPQWATALCLQALDIDEDDSHAFYQLACAYSAIGQYEEALSFLARAVQKRSSYLAEMLSDPELKTLIEQDGFSDFLDRMQAHTTDIEQLS